MHITPLLEHAARQHAEGQVAQAVQSYQQVLALDPEHAVALASLGVLAGQQGQALDAVALLLRASRLEPGNALFHHNHGEALRQSGQLQKAEEALRRALELDPHLVPAWDSLIGLAQEAHAQSRAAGDGERVAVLASELARLQNNLGNAWMARGGGTQAVACYRNALAWYADYAMAYSNLGNVLRLSEQVAEAEAACRKATALDPQLPEAWNNLGTTLTDQGRFDEGMLCYDKALALRPTFPQALHNRGSGALFARLHETHTSYAEIAARHRAWGATQAAPRNHSLPNTRQPGRVLRVGYLSADFRGHAMRHFLEPLLARHDTAQVEVVCYAQGPMADAHTQRLMQYGHRWQWVHGLDDAALAAQIARDGIDILVDCMGHTHNTRIAALATKPAPVMLAWLGYLCTSGLPAMDHRLSDEWVDPPSTLPGLAPEQVLHIPGGMMAWHAHANAPPPAASPPCLANGHITFGSLNNVQKINRLVVAQWAKLLHALPEARLLLQSRMLGDAGVAGRIRGLFEAFDIAPARLALRTASDDFLRTYDAIDIALDPFPYGGGATTCDALWMGVPVVSLAGARPSGRLSSSILARIGQQEWVANNPAEYFNIASALARDRAGLARHRQTLRAQMAASALCDEAGFVRQLETTYRVAWTRWCSAVAPRPPA